jgi:ABC-2 type transport system ATP-binding protein
MSEIRAIGPENVIEVNDLVRVYKTSQGFFHKQRKETLAVDHISFSVKKGELFGILGPNGAGKTTTIKMLTTLLIPTSGSAKVLGFDVGKDPYQVRKRIGLIIGGERGLYYRISGRQNLRYFADLYSVPRLEREQRIEDVLRKVDLLDRADDRVEDYSRGMKQRLHIAKGLINDPEVIFMDEPTIGLDPQASRDTRNLIKDLLAGGKTILMTTHYMFEADELCDRLAVINKGKIVAMDTPRGLKSLMRDTCVVEVEGFGLTDKDVEMVRSIPGVRAVSATMNEDKQVLRVQVADAGEMLAPIAGRLSGSNVIDMKVKEPTLEDAYLWLVEKND